LMLPRRQVSSVRLADLGPGTTDATDLTGPTPGLAVEVRLQNTATARLAPRPGEPQGRAIPLPALLVSPSRPGAALAEARRRGYPSE
jgi:hypothetical protein